MMQPSDAKPTAVHEVLRFPTRLRPRRQKLLLAFIVCAAMVPAGIAIAHTPGIRSYLGYPIAALCGVCAIALLGSVLPGSSYLEVNARGLSLCAMYRKSFFAWSDIARFVPIDMGGHGMVGIEFAPHYTGSALGRRWAQRIGGVDGALPDTYGYTAEELVAALNEARRRLHA